MNQHSYRQAFHYAYSTFSTVVYSSALRISGNKALAQKILAEVFIDLHRQGLLAKPGLLHLSNLMPAVFRCAAIILKPELPEHVIRHRIANERQYLLGHVHTEHNSPVIAAGV